MSARADRMMALLDYMISNDATIEEIEDELDVSRGLANRAIRDVRRYLGDMDDVFLVCEPQGQRQKWLYRLVDGRGTVNAESGGQWHVNRIRDTESRLETMLWGFEAAVRATKGNTIEGRKARVLERSFRRLLEDLGDIDDTFS